MTEPRDDAPYDSDNPDWRDTWWFNATDLEKGRALHVHCMWSERQKRARHTLGIYDGDRAETRIVITTESPFVSSMLTLDVDPYKSMRLRVPDREIDVTWTAWQEPVDFCQPPFTSADKVMNSMHFQASGRAKGKVLGEPFQGPGHRDRTAGPRKIAKETGRTVGFTFSGADEDCAFLSHLSVPAAAPFTAAPTVSSGYTCIGGKITPISNPAETTVLRRSNGLPTLVRIAGEEFTVRHILGPSRWTSDANLSDPSLGAEGPVFSNSYSFIIADSAHHGRFAAGYGESLLMTY